MKKYIHSLFFILSFNLLISQTPTFSVYYLDAVPGTENVIGEMFDQFWGDVEFKSGGAYLERMDRGNVDGTHRFVRFGELENFGLVTSKTSEQWQAHRDRLDPYIIKRGPKYSGRIMGSNDVNPASKPYIQIHDLEVKDPAKWSAAMAKLINDTNSNSNGNMIVYGSYDIGSPLGASHWVALGSDNLQSLIMAIADGQKNVKEWATYHKTSGGTKVLNKYSLRIIKDYGEF